MPKQRIGIITPTFPPYRGGIGTVAMQDARDLSALGYAVTVFTPHYGKQTDSEEQYDGYTVKRLRSLFEYGNAAVVPSLYAHAKACDTIIVEYPFFGGVLPAMIGAIMGKSRIITVYHHDVHASGIRSAIFRAHAALIRPTLFSWTHHIVGTSMDYLQHSSIGSIVRRNPKRVSEIPPSVSLERFFPGDPASNIRDNIRSAVGEGVVALMVGGLDTPHYFKGVPIMLNAMRQSELQTLRLVIVGSGDLMEQFKRMAFSYGIADRVMFAGNVDDDTLPEFHRAADIFVFPSIDASEAFGIAALEAAASGLPIVASNLPGVRTVVKHQENGLCIPAGDEKALAHAIHTLIKDETLRKALGAKGRHRAEHEYAEPIRRQKWQALINWAE